MLLANTNPPSLEAILSLLVFKVPDVILSATKLSTIAFFINPFCTVTLSAVKTKECMLALVRFPLTKVLMSATVAFKLLMFALVAFKSAISALFIIALLRFAYCALRLVTLALVAFKSSILALLIRAVLIVAMLASNVPTFALTAVKSVILAF